MNRVSMATVLTVTLLGGVGGASAQMELGTVQGTIRDEAGKPIEGVVVKFKDLSRGREVEVKTDKDGKFYRRGLQAVDYELTVEKAGYNPIKDTLKVSPGLEKRYDFKLVKGAPEGAGEFAKGVAAYNAGDNAGAAAFFEEAVKKAPNVPEVRVNLALAYLRLSRVDDAIAQLETAASQAPDQPTTLFQLGAAYVEAKKYDKAVEMLEKGLTQQPDVSNPTAYEATITLGAVYFATGQIDQANARFEKALAAKPDAVAPKLGLGKCAASKGQTERALDFFKQVVAAAPGTPEAAEAEGFIKALSKG